MTNRVLAIAVLTFCAAGAACAQQGAAALPTFAQALAQAVANSAELRKLDFNVAAAGQDVRRARSLFLPHVDLNSSTQSIEAFGSVPGLESLLLAGRRRVYNSTGTLTLSLNAYNGGIDAAAVQAAGERRDEGTLQARIRRTALAATVLERYHALRQAELELAAARLRQQARRDYASQVRADYALGKKSTLAVAEAGYDSDSSELTQTLKERAYRNALRDLDTVIGTPPAPVRADWAAWNAALAAGKLLALPNRRAPAVPTAAQPAALAAAGETGAYSRDLAAQGFDAAARSTDVDVAISRVRQADIDVRRARGRYLPRIDIFVRNNFAGISENSFYGAYNHQSRDKRIFGATLSWNLFDGFDTSADVSAATLRKAAAEADQELAVDEQRRRADELSRPLADAIEEQQVEARRLQLMRQKVDINRVKLELGRLDATSAGNDQMELSVQTIEMEKRAETIAYYQARLLLRTGAR
jgi:outer membrane protein TolC